MLHRAVLVLTLLLPGPASAATWIIDSLGLGDFPTIQDAIDGSANGDVIQVVAGTYNESLDFGGKLVTVESLSGSSQTTIASNFCSTRGTLPGRTIISPRLISISSSNVNVTDIGG